MQASVCLADINLLKRSSYGKQDQPCWVGDFPWPNTRCAGNGVCTANGDGTVSAARWPNCCQSSPCDCRLANAVPLRDCGSGDMLIAQWPTVLLYWQADTICTILCQAH